MLTAKQVCEAMTVLDESVRVDPSCITADLPESNNKGTAVFDNGHLRRVNNTDECKRLGFVPVKKKYLLKYFGTVYPVLNAHMLDNLRMYHIGMKEFNDAKNNRVRTKKPSRPPKLFKKRTPFAAQITTLDELFHRKLCANYDELLDADDWRDEVNKLIGDDKLLKAYRALYNVKHATKKTIKAAVEELNTLLDEEKITDSDMQSMKTAAEGKRTALITASQSNVTTGINKTFMDMWTDDFVFVKLPQEFTGVIAEKPEIPQLAHLEAPEAAKAKPPTPAKAETPEERKKREKERKEREKDEKDEKDKLHDEKRAMGAGILFLEGDKCSPFPGHFRTTPYQQGYRRAQESFFVHWVREVYAKNVNLIRESDALWAQYKEDKKSGYYCERPPFLNKQKLWSEANFALMNEMRRVRIQPKRKDDTWSKDSDITFEVFVVPDYEKYLGLGYTVSQKQNVREAVEYLQENAESFGSVNIVYKFIRTAKEKVQIIIETYETRMAQMKKKAVNAQPLSEAPLTYENLTELTPKLFGYGEEMNKIIKLKTNDSPESLPFSKLRMLDEFVKKNKLQDYFTVKKPGKDETIFNGDFSDVIRFYSYQQEYVERTDAERKNIRKKKNATKNVFLIDNDGYISWNKLEPDTQNKVVQYLIERVERFVKIIYLVSVKNKMPSVDDPFLIDVQFRTRGNRSNYLNNLTTKKNEDLKAILSRCKDDISKKIDEKREKEMEPIKKARAENKEENDKQAKLQKRVRLRKEQYTIRIANRRLMSDIKKLDRFADPDLALMQQDLAYGSRGYKAAEVSE